MDRPTTKNTPPQIEDAQISEQELRLRLNADTGDDELFEVKQGVTIIGTADDCTIRVNDPSVSRKHCQIERTDSVVRIKDLGSTNGTAVDGVPIETAYLRPGARIRLGTLSFSLDVAYLPLRGGSREPQHFGFRGLVGKSPAMTKLFAARDRIAKSDVTVLIQGETGTGKSALARSIHMAGDRQAHPFIVFDCSAVAPNLVDSALFGHEKGAFTGAQTSRTGAIESAGAGTLFIDELTELSAELQPKLLRALEEREFTPLGSSKPRPVRCRIIAATQHDIRARVEAGSFRRDLYFRLAVVVVPLPPLRERIEDIPLLVDQLLFTTDTSITPFSDMPSAVQRAILDYAWPGNIRELRNYLARLMLSRETSGDWPKDIPLPTDLHAGLATPTVTTRDDALLDIVFKEAKAQSIASFEKRYLKRLLARSEYNLSQASRLSGINRRHLDDMLMRHDLDKKSLMSKGNKE